MPIDLFGFTIGRKQEPTKTLQAFAKPEYEDGALPVSSGGVYGTYLDTDATIKTEFELVNRYRDMALQAEVEAAVDDIVNEAIVTSHEVPPVRINLDNINVSDNIKEKIKSELDACLLTDEELADESWKKESSDSWPVHRLESDLDLNHNHIPMTNDGKKVGRNDKIKLISPDGNEVEVKFKKIESYLSKGYKLASQTTA